MDIPPEFFVFVAIGLAAQTVDGALGMAYGVTSSSLLLAFGLPPALASASVHAAEVATTGVSGLSHGLFGNIDRGLLWQLALPGVAGGALGAWFLGSVDLAWLRPLVAAYLLLWACCWCCAPSAAGAPRRGAARPCRWASAPASSMPWAAAAGAR
jgi:uncharacterized membrane protein YfcA